MASILNYNPRILSNLNVRTKLVFLVMVPLLAIILLSTIFLMESYSSKKEYEKLSTNMHLASSISLLIHETQKERGMSAGFLGSKGEKFSDKIVEQRKLTDKLLNSFKTFVAGVDKTHMSSEVQSYLDEVLQEFTKLDSIRAGVSSLNIKLGVALGYYTNINAKLLNIIPHTTFELSDNEISTQILAYYNFLMSKERAGIQRAVGSNILASKNLSTPLSLKFYQLIVLQDTYLQEFLMLGDHDTIAKYKEIMKGPFLEEVKRIEKAILDGKLDDDATYWFSQITKKINLLKKVDDMISNTIIMQVEDGLVAKTNNFYIFVVILAAIFIFINATAHFMFVNITQAVKEIYNGFLGFVLYLERKSNEFVVIESRGSDEFSKLADLINENAKELNDATETDMLCAGETILVLNKMQQGEFGCKIGSPASTPQVQTFVDSVNQTLEVQAKLYKEILEVLNEYTHYDYRKTINIEAEGEYKELVDGINSLRDSIISMLQENMNQGDVLNRNSSNLLQNVDKLNQNSNTAAASLEETAAAVEEITGNIKNSVENIAVMSKYSSELIDVSSKGQGLANETASSMLDINNEVSSISEAITVIDQIAFQTNILSLNAAVEAATAGEAGKGFAVVAGEVRNLAARSAEAASEIKELVENAQTKANKGKGISDDMINGYNQLIDKINQTMELIKNVEHASKEQQSGMVQINDTITSLDTQTQQNANIASQTNEAAIQMSAISKEIEEAVKQKKF